MTDVLLDIGLAADGRIVLRIHDVGMPAETEITMSVAEARAFVAHLEAVIVVAEALPEGRRISMDEGLGVRPREMIERDIAIARQDLADARYALDALEDELDALPPEGIDEELWHARHDPRQLGLWGRA